jgi:hypothetical protein
LVELQSQAPVYDFPSLEDGRRTRIALVKRRVLWFLVAALVTVVIITVVYVLPRLLYPRLSNAELRGVASAETRIQLQQAQSRLQNDARSTLLQATAGLLLAAGAVATWRQVQVNREGHVTERFTHAVDQVGDDKSPDKRIGGIYALERVAKNSRPDRPQIQYILGAFVRGHSPWPPTTADDPKSGLQEIDMTVPWMYDRSPDVQAALTVLGRLPRSRDAASIYLSRIDLRRANLNGANLSGATIRRANLSRATLEGAQLDKAQLQGTDLRLADARSACFAKANLQNADLRNADLRGADMRASHLDEAMLDGATADATTAWPDGFDHSSVVMTNEPAASGRTSPPSRGA